MIVYREELKTSVGTLMLLSTERGVCYIGFVDQGDLGDDFLRKNFAGAEIKSGGEYNREAANEIKAYLAGKLKDFKVKLDLISSGFSRQALLKVKAIPYGKVRTYGEIAAALGNPKAARAVGNANRLNPIPIIIPCHRVVASNGLGGYGGGLPLKKKLLNLEGAGLG